MRPLILAAAWLTALGALASGRPMLQLAAGAGVVALALAAYRDRRGLLLGAAVVGVMLLAWLRWQAATAPPPAESVAWWADGERHTLTGTVESPPEPRGASQRFVLRVDSVEGAAGPVAASGKVLVRVAASARYREGDVLRLDGQLDQPPQLEQFDYAAYLARQGITAIMEYPRARRAGSDPPTGVRAWLVSARERMHDTLWTGLPAEQAALADGILTGWRAQIPASLTDDFNRAGVSHLVVISGYNIALVGALVVATLGPWLGRRWSLLAALLAIWFYSVFVGLGPSVARAAVMGSVAVLAMLSGRPYGAGAALVMAAALLSAQDPLILQDVSFQLSFAATAGLLVLAPWPLQLGRRLLSEPARASAPTWRSLALAGWDTVAVTLSATAATMPLILLYFGRISFISPLANLLLVPLFPAVLVTGAAGVATALFTPLSPVAALLPLGAVLELTIGIARACAAPSWASVSVGGIGIGVATVTYVLMAAAVLGRLPGRRRQEMDIERHHPLPLLAGRTGALALAPAALLLLIAGIRFSNGGGPPAETRADVFALSGAPITLVRFAGGGTVLVDTGLAPDGARAALDSALGDQRELNAVVLTRIAPSSVGGLESVLNRYRVGMILAPEGDEAAGWMELAQRNDVPVYRLRDGMIVGRDSARLELHRADAERWAATLLVGGHEVTLGESGGDAGYARQDRAIYLYANQERAQLRLPLTTGSHAALSSDGRSLRLHPQRGQRAHLLPCSGACDERANEP